MPCSAFNDTKFPQETQIGNREKINNDLLILRFCVIVTMVSEHLLCKIGLFGNHRFSRVLHNYKKEIGKDLASRLEA